MPTKLALVLLLGAWAVRPSFGQTLGEITGVVTDPTGAVVAGAAVTVTNPQTGLTRAATTNTAGNYVFPALQPGTYNVRVEMQGFRTEVRSDVQLQVQQTARLDFQLAVGAVTETVEVAGGAPLLNTENATVGTVIDNQRIVELPLNGRNFIQLVALSPNVNANFASGGAATSRQGGDRSRQQISVAGMRREFNNYTLDGIANTDVNFNTYTFLPSIDALQEFKVQTGVYSAEFGRAAAQVNVSTKGGTNQYHGAAFEFLRNSHLDARPFGFTSRVPVTAPFKWNQYGFALGGPVQIPKLFRGRDRLFFLSNYEGFRERRQTQVVYSTPPAAMRRGDFAQLLPGTVLRDPLNRDAAGNKLPFPGNIIPANRLDPIAIKLLEFYPEPNIAGTGLANNYLSLQNNTNDKDQFTQRIDLVESSRSNWFGRYSWSDEYQVEPALKLNGHTLDVKVDQAMISNTRVLSPNWVNEFRFGYTGFFNNYAGELTGKRDPIKEFGIGLIDPDPAAWGTPGISITGFSGFGDDVNGPFTINNHAFQWVNNLSWTRGAHSLKFGLEIRRDRFNQVGNQNARGVLDFQTIATGYGFGDYMLGYVQRTQDAGGLAVSQFRTTSQAYYIDDTWKVRPNLTLSLGLRYEYTPPWASKNDTNMNIWFPQAYDGPGLHPCYVRIGSGEVYQNTIVRFDPRICVARDGRLGDRLVQHDRNDFAPRLGVAWSPTPKWTVRAGAGVFFVVDTGNPRFDMSRNMSGRLTSTADPQLLNLTIRNPFSQGATICGVPSPPFVCVQTPQGLANDYYRRTPYVTQYELNFQRQLTNDTVLEFGYLGSQAHKLERLTSRNLPPPSPTGSVVSRQPVPEFGNIQVLQGVVSSNYHSLSAKLTRRLSGGLTYLAGYTFAKSIDNGSGIRTLGTDQLKPQDGRCWSCERGRSIFDTRHRFVTSVLYDAPLGKGRRFLSQGAAAALLGGWQFGSIVAASRGFPLNIGSGRDQSNTGHGYDRPNGVPGQSVNLATSQRNTGRWFNTQAVVLQPLGTYGTLGRNIVTGPGLVSVDFSTVKRFAFTEQKYLQFRFEAFNFFNHPNFGDPNTNRSAGAFGTITSTRSGINMRELQFSLKLVF
jgi:outer membrane receptor protein involved in Fe transport